MSDEAMSHHPRGEVRGTSTSNDPAELIAEARRHHGVPVCSEDNWCALCIKLGEWLGTDEWCMGCVEDHPCSTLRMADALEAASARLEAVAALHKPIRDSRPVCEHCTALVGHSMWWPCATARAAGIGHA